MVYGGIANGRDADPLFTLIQASGPTFLIVRIEVCVNLVKLFCDVDSESTGGSLESNAEMVWFGRARNADLFSGSWLNVIFLSTTTS